MTNIKQLVAYWPWLLIASFLAWAMFFAPQTTSGEIDAKCRQMVSTVTRSKDQILEFPDKVGPGTTKWAETVYVYHETFGNWPATGC